MITAVNQEVRRTRMKICNEIQSFNERIENEKLVEENRMKFLSNELDRNIEIQAEKRRKLVEEDEGEAPVNDNDQKKDFEVDHFISNTKKMRLPAVEKNIVSFSNASMLLRRGYELQSKKQYKKALQYFKKATSICMYMHDNNEMKSYESLFRCLRNVSTILIKLKRFAEAFRYLKCQLLFHRNFSQWFYLEDKRFF